MEMKANGVAEVYLYDEIGFWGITADDFRRSLTALGDVSHINLHINCIGGNVFDGTAIYNLLKNHSATVASYVEGIAASMGTVIAMAGDTIEIAANSYWMIHNPSMGVRGDAAELGKHVKLLERMTDLMANLYSAKTGMSHDEAITAMSDTTWYIGQEAVDAGFCDSTGIELDLAACFTEEMTGIAEKKGDFHVRAEWLQNDTPKTLIEQIQSLQPAPAGKTKPMEATMSTKEKGSAGSEKALNDEEKAAIKAEAVAEFQAAQKLRKTKVSAVFSTAKMEEDHADLMAKCLEDEECDAISASAKLLDAIGKGKAPTHDGLAVVSAGGGRDKFIADAEQALCVRAGLTDRPSERNSVMGHTLSEIARMSLANHSVQTGHLDKMEMIAMAFTHSSSDFSQILANTANKSMLKGYDEAAEVFTQFTSVGNLPDFKSNTRVDIGNFPSLRKVREGSEYKHITTGERGESAILATYGELFGITRQAIINDDLSAFTRLPRKMGTAAVRTVGDLVFAILTDNPVMSDGDALFHANHGNLATAAVISTASMDAARIKMGLQKDGNAQLNLRPKFSLVSISDESLAKTVMSAENEYDASAKNSRVPNSVRGMTTVISDARLEAADAWFLSVDPGPYDAIEVMYLDGNSQPVLESKNGWNIDGVEFKVRLDAAAKAWDYRGLVKTPKS